MIHTRRKFLIGLGSLLAAPAIVHAGNLMPVKALRIGGNILDAGDPPLSQLYDRSPLAESMPWWKFWHQLAEDLMPQRQSTLMQLDFTSIDWSK